jgi:predicted amidohydrolase
MPHPPLYYAAACQVDRPNPKHRGEMHEQTSAMLAMMERAVAGYRAVHDVRLVVFPEFAHAAPVYFTTEELLEKLAIPAENEHVERIAKKARELGCHVQTGSFLEVDARWPDLVFNTTLLISPEGKVLSRYRKLNPWIPWEVHASPHDVEGYPDDPLPVVETEIGRLGVATCYDWLFPEVTRELALKGADVLIRISAYMDPWGATPPMDWWTVINRARAIENMAYVVAANQAASLENYPPFSWPGGSMICDYDGRVLAEATPGPGAKVVVAPISIATLHEERARRIAHVMPAHHRAELYRAQRRATFPPQKRHTIEDLERSIRDAKQKMGYGG